MPKGISDRKTKILCVEHWIAKGFNEIEAREKINELQKNRAAEIQKKCEIKHKSSVKIGDRFGKWTINSLDFKHTNDLGLTGHKTPWFINAECDCGFKKYISIQSLTSGKSKGCKVCAKNKGNKHASWTGHGELSGKRISSIKAHARWHGRTYNLTKEFMSDLFESQNRKCAISGIELSMEDASLDRIDSDIGYEVDNVQWVHKDINRMKSDFTMNQFVKWCKLIAKNNRNK